jgi:hypothetical protein
MNSFCSQCGQALADDSKFCSGCGNKHARALPGLSPASQDFGMPLEKPRAKGKNPALLIGGLLFISCLIIIFTPRKSDPPLSEAQKHKEFCQYFEQHLYNKPMSEYSRSDLDQLKACEAHVATPEEEAKDHADLQRLIDRTDKALRKNLPSSAVPPANAWQVIAPTNPESVMKLVQTVSHGIHLTLLFDNKKLSLGDLIFQPVNVAAGDDSCFIEPNSSGMGRNLRITFDDNEPRWELWRINDNHTGVTLQTPDKARAFVEELEKHSKFAIELGCNSYHRGQVIAFDVRGLKETLDKEGLRIQ